VWMLSPTGSRREAVVKAVVIGNEIEERESSGGSGGVNMAAMLIEGRELELDEDEASPPFFSLFCVNQARV